MMNGFFGSPGFIWFLAVIVMAFTGTLNSAALVIICLIALGLLGAGGDSNGNESLPEGDEIKL